MDFKDYKGFDENLKGLICSGDVNKLNHFIEQNKLSLLINKGFIDYIRETSFRDDQIYNQFEEVKEEFLFEVYLSRSEFIYDKTIKWLLKNASLDKIKKIVQSKLGYKLEVIEKIYISFFPSNNINFYRKKAENKGWSENYIYKNENRIKTEFSNLFINELDVSEVKIIKSEAVRKEIHPATDLANFVFCPASYAISQTYKIDLREQENVLIGTQEHERQRLLSMSDRQRIEYQSDVDSTTFSIDFKRIMNAECISQGHNTENQKIYYSKKGNLSGIPDYIFKDESGYFAVEEKYKFNKYEDLKCLYENHKIQGLAYLYGLSEFKFSEVYILYWFIIEEGGYDNYYVNDYRLFSLTKTEENEKTIKRVFNNLVSIQNRIPYPFPPNKIDYRKCIKCSYFTYCEYKKGNKHTIELEPLLD